MFNKFIEWLNRKRKLNYIKAARLTFLSAFILPVAVVFFYRLSFHISCISDIMDIKGVNEVGDFLGGTMTPMLTVAAFFLLKNSDKIQREALTVSKDELMANREEMAKSAAALDEQKRIMNAEQQMNEAKNSLDIFFTLFNNWRALSERNSFDFYYNASVDPQMRDGNPTQHYIFNGDTSIGKKINMAEYGKHLKVFLVDENIRFYGNFVSQPSIRQYGKREYGYIIDNLTVNAVPIINNFNNLIDYTLNYSVTEKNKDIMKNNIRNAISWGECFVMNMLVSDYIIGEITSEQVWRQKLKYNLELLELNLENYDGAEERFILEHTGSFE